MILTTMLKVLFQFLCALCLTRSICGMTPADTQKLYEKIILEAKTSVEIMTPGFFSINLSKVLTKKVSNGVHVRILLDSTYLNDSSNCIGILTPNLSLRIHEETRLVPMTILILDRKKVVLGGEYLEDNKMGPFNPLILEDSPTVKRYLSIMQNLWAGADPAYTESILTALEFRDDSEVIRSEDTKHSQSQTTDGFVASTNSKIYHRLNSPAAKRIKPSNRIFFRTEAEAIQSKRIRANNF